MRRFRVSFELETDEVLDWHPWHEPTPEWIERLVAHRPGSIYRMGELSVAEVKPPLLARFGMWLLGDSWHLDHCPQCKREGSSVYPCGWYLAHTEAPVP